MLDADHPFFAQVWRRWAVVAVCFVWSGFELWNGATIWAAGFAALGGYALWALIIKPWRDGA
ncbi:hypothetical protein [Jannaschia sp. 2305UL9-9]|uniref:hypothetical protein n=1 Tax=Jannaschia sp. 2305UL9-9 TaxID=3121638 RepID=UPI003529810F